MPDQDHVVLHSLRQTVLCLRCRAEKPLPPPGPITAYMAAVTAIQKRHLHCPPAPVPAPHTVRLSPGGHRLERDHHGLWWEWTPAHPEQPVPYQVTPRTTEQVRGQLASLTRVLNAQPHLDLHDRVSLDQVAALQGVL